MKILHVLWNLNAAGTETWLLNVLRRIDKNRFHFDFCLLDGQRGVYIEEVESLGSHVFGCPRGLNPASFAMRFLDLVGRGGYPVVHSHIDGGLPDPWFHRLYRRWMERWIQAYATDRLAVSRSAARALFGPAWESDVACRVLHCGVDLELFCQHCGGNDLRHELGLPAGVPVIGHVGRFRPTKNHEFLIRVAEETIRRRPEVRFVLVGDGELRAAIQERVRQVGIAERVVFTGARKAAVVQDALEYLPLKIPPSEWAQALLRILERGRLDREACLGALRASPFSIENSTRYLEAFYDHVA
jgi:glycosyltransferase involved in cell wall biosynthesis